MDNVIIVPLYKNELNEFEHISLKQCFKIFTGKTIIAIKPKSLNLSCITKEYPFNDVVSFDDEFFVNINGYNKLMLSAIFYERFLAYNYMLIYQTDAFVFTDQLDFWANAGYDYIGAPWLRPLKNNNLFNRYIFAIKCYIYTKFNVKKNGLPKGKQLYNKVGNGGFSLRNISKFHEICIVKRELAEQYINLNNPSFNEDIFWSIEVNRKSLKLKIPNLREGLKFAFENYPAYAFRLNNGELPFGCHAWEKNLPFWSFYLKNKGYNFDDQF